MNKRALILGLIILLSGAGYAEDGIYDVSSGISSFGNYARPRYNSRFNLRNPINRFSRIRNGTLTGFSPPVYNSYSPQYQTCGIGANIKRFFNPNYNNNYVNSPYYNPYQSGVYRNIHSNGFTNLFSNPNPSYNYQNGNGFDINGTDGMNMGTNVTIID